MKLLIANPFEWTALPDKTTKYPDAKYDFGQWMSRTINDNSISIDYWRVQRESEPPGDDYHGVVIGGSWSSVYESPQPSWLLRLRNETQRWIEGNTPLLGICYGHQLIAQVLGGKVEKNPKGWELGVYQIELTPAGKADWIFRNWNPPHHVFQTHQDIVSVPPSNAECLATNGTSEYQALRIGDSIRTVQFHPEYTEERIRRIFQEFPKDIQQAATTPEMLLPNLVYAHQSGIIIKNFTNEIKKPKRILNQFLIL